MERILMKSDWRIQSNYIIGKGEIFQCYRLKDWTQPKHSGNMIHDKKTFKTKEEAVLRCRSLNAELVSKDFNCGHGPH